MQNKIVWEEEKILFEDERRGNKWMRWASFIMEWNREVENKNWKELKCEKNSVINNYRNIIEMENNNKKI